MAFNQGAGLKTRSKFTKSTFMDSMLNPRRRVS